MIIFEANNKIFCILNNPKCGTVTITSTIYLQIRDKYKIICDLACGEYEFDSPKHYHCNMKGAVKFLQSKHINPKKVIFLTIIRQPVERCLSAYFYTLKYSKITKFNKASQTIEEDFLYFIEKDLYWSNFHPNNFRKYDGITTTHNIRLEHLFDDFKHIFQKYNLDFKIDDLKIVKNTTERVPINITREMLDIITTQFKPDYDDGKYNNDKYL